MTVGMRSVTRTSCCFHFKRLKCTRNSKIKEETEYWEVQVAQMGSEIGPRSRLMIRWYGLKLSRSYEGPYELFQLGSRAEHLAVCKKSTWGQTLTSLTKNFMDNYRRLVVKSEAMDAV